MRVGAVADHDADVGDEAVGEEGVQLRAVGHGAVPAAADGRAGGG